MIKFLVLALIALAALVSSIIAPRQASTVREVLPQTATPAGTTVSSSSPFTSTFGSLFIEHVYDGDTIRLSNGEKVRLIGVDTPESSYNPKLERDSQRSGQSKTKIISMGKEAARFTSLMAEGQRVRLEYDVQARDKYGRLLAYVYLQVCEGPCKIDAAPGHHYVTLDDGVYDFLNATLVKSGYAQAYTIPPDVKYRDLFRELQREAREAKRGLWVNRSFDPMERN
jgi:micrococcal nuclease